jgi:Uncharacterised nucleotidyltransferase
MSQLSLPPVKSVLLDILSSARPVSAEAVAALSRDDWAAISKIVRQHRLGPMLDNRHRERGPNWPIPEAIRTEWAQAARQAAMRALRIQATLMQIAECLSPIEVEFLVLKGGWLAWHAYPKPGLRPMRDLDLLVDPDTALRVHSALVGIGFKSDADGPALEHALAHGKHLPPIQSAIHGINVEIHSRLYHAGSSASDGAEAMAGRVARKIAHRLGRFDIGYLSPTDSLLHLIVHAVYDHHFDNGPVVFDDIAFILATQLVDWSLFWSMAEQNSWTNGCALAFGLTEHQHGTQPVTWPEAGPIAVPSEILIRARQLCLQDWDVRGTTHFFGDVLQSPDLASRLSRLGRRLLVPRIVLSNISGLSLNSPFLWLTYPMWLARSIGKGVTYAFSRSAQSNAARLSGVAEWLSNAR